MAEILQAYQTLNKVLKLGLSHDQMMAAEMQFKLDFADRMKFPAAMTKNPTQFSAEWEVVGTLAPRKRAIRTLTKKSLDQLKAEGLEAAQAKLAKPTSRVAAVRETAAKVVSRKKK